MSPTITVLLLKANAGLELSLSEYPGFDGNIDALLRALIRNGLISDYRSPTNYRVTDKGRDIFMKVCSVSMFFSNQLEPDEEEGLELLQEECAEVIQAVSKIQRHGFDSTNPDVPNPLPNKYFLEKEIGHVLNAVDLLVDLGCVNKEEIEIHRKSKKQSISKWLHHQ